MGPKQQGLGQGALGASMRREGVRPGQEGAQTDRETSMQG